MPEAQSKAPRSLASEGKRRVVQRVKSSVLNDAHIDKWMAHPLLLLLLLLLPRLCLPDSSSQGTNSPAPSTVSSSVPLSRPCQSWHSYKQQLYESRCTPTRRLLRYNQLHPERALSGVPPMRCVRQGEREARRRSPHTSVRLCVALGRSSSCISSSLNARNGGRGAKLRTPSFFPLDE